MSAAADRPVPGRARVRTAAGAVPPRRRFVQRMLTSILLLGLVSPAATAQEIPCEPQPAQDSVFAFVGVNVIPMTRDTVLRNQTVIVRDGRIYRIGRTGRVRVPPAARVIAGQGRWLMPGLVDAHFHLATSGGESIEPVIVSLNQKLLSLLLARGVTSAIELGSLGLSGDVAGTRLHMRGEIAAGRRIGPTLYVASDKANDTTLSHAGGIQLVDEARVAGYDLIKVYNKLSKPGYRGIILRAEQTGMPVVGHVVRSVGLEGVLGSGQRGIPHLEEFLPEYFGFRITDTTEVQGSKLDPGAIPYLAGITREANVWVTPTMVTFKTMLAQAEGLNSVLSRPEVKYIPRVLMDALWGPGQNPYSPRFSHPRIIGNLREALAFQNQMLRAFHHSGVPLLVGTDAPAAGVVPGYSVHEELANLVEAGLTPYEALVAATRNPAAYLGTQEFGTVEEGRRADVLLLEANPLEDVAHAARITGVMARGRWLDSNWIAATLACLRGAERKE